MSRGRYPLVSSGRIRHPLDSIKLFVRLHALGSFECIQGSFECIQGSFGCMQGSFDCMYIVCMHFKDESSDATVYAF